MKHHNTPILKLIFTNLSPEDKEMIVTYVTKLDKPELDEINVLSNTAVEYIQYNVAYSSVKKEITGKKENPFYKNEMFSTAKLLFPLPEKKLKAIFDRIFTHCKVELYKNKNDMDFKSLTRKLPELEGIF